MSAWEYDLDPRRLAQLIAFVQGLGVSVGEGEPLPGEARFVGTMQGRHITLFRGMGNCFKAYFTVAHLYGHMVQFASGFPVSLRADALIAKPSQAMTQAEIQLIFDHEYEAAAIGRRLLAAVGPVDSGLDYQYTRIFCADFHYLIYVLEGGIGGPAVFSDFLRRQPILPHLIPADSRPLVDLAVLPPKERPVIVV